MNNKLKKTVFAMLKENTGIAMMDSGGSNGRMWQRNASKSLTDFENEPEVTEEDESPTVSLFHYLTQHAGLSLDEQCDDFNDNFVPAKNWDSDIYGVSKEGREYLKDKGFRILESFNSYNGEQYLSQVIQGTYITQDGTNMPDYVLLQIHGGADVRGGYTDARMFKVESDGMTPEIYMLENNE